jgi:hypothetical protein
MYWQAILADRWIDRERIRDSVSVTFRLSPVRIDVVDDTAEIIGPVPPTPRILVERMRYDGDFPMRLDVFVGGDELERPVTSLTGTLVRARELARRLDAVLLLGTGPIGHDEQLRVAPDGTVDIVELDGDEMDEERFVIVGSRPFSELPAEALQAPA